MLRFEVRFTHPSEDERDILSHTFATSYEFALLRVSDVMEASPETWEGWSATVGRSGESV